MALLSRFPKAWAIRSGSNTAGGRYGGISCSQVSFFSCAASFQVVRSVGSHSETWTLCLCRVRALEPCSRWARSSSRCWRRSLRFPSLGGALCVNPFVHRLRCAKPGALKASHPAGGPARGRYWLTAVCGLLRSSSAFPSGY